jgi:glycosyltransferase involved in cell wall biosynthesis
VGLPTISTKVGGVEEFIENQVEGVLIDSNMDDDRKAEKVAEAIIAFVKDPGMAEKIGRNGRERLAKEFSADRVSRRFSEMCEELILDHLSRYRLEPD